MARAMAAAAVAEFRHRSSRVVVGGNMSDCGAREGGGLGDGIVIEPSLGDDSESQGGHDDDGSGDCDDEDGSGDCEFFCSSILMS